MNILLVDDDDDYLEYLFTIVNKLTNADVYTVNSSTIAIEILNQRNFDVVISDYQMPLINGLLLLQKVKKRSESTVRILLSSQSILDILGESSMYYSSFNHYMRKDQVHTDLPSVLISTLNKMKC